MNSLVLSTAILEQSTEKKQSVGSPERQTAMKLCNLLKDFKIDSLMSNIEKGPSVVRYEFSVDHTTRLAKLEKIADNIRLALSVPDVRVLAPVPNRPVIGIEVPNNKRQVVRLRSLLESKEISASKFHLPVCLGKNITGRNIVIDLAKTPHLLIAGATGSGKSVCVHSIISSLMFQRDYTELQFLMIDPKRVELISYNGLPNLITKVITLPQEAVSAFSYLVEEMNRRYELLENSRARSIDIYNASAQDGLPYIVVVIDEFADLMLIAKKQIEANILRLTSMARAVGIHLVLATQRPSTDIITGVIKANFPARIALKVASRIDSRVILDTGGAERLLGYGDMLYSEPSMSYPERIQGVYLSDSELTGMQETLSDSVTALAPYIDLSGYDNAVDEQLYDRAYDLVCRRGECSSSLLQRELFIDINTAVALVEKLAERDEAIANYLNKIHNQLTGG